MFLVFQFLAPQLATFLHSPNTEVKILFLFSIKKLLSVLNAFFQVKEIYFNTDDIMVKTISLIIPFFFNIEPKIQVYQNGYAYLEKIRK